MAVHHLLASPTAAHIAAQSAATTDLTSGRLVGTTAAFVALASVIIGRLALTRSTDHRSITGSRKRAVLALAAGLAGLLTGVVNLAVADGGPGTGNGVVAGAAALALGLTGTVLGGLALNRTRHTA